MITILIRLLTSCASRCNDRDSRYIVIQYDIVTMVYLWKGLAIKDHSLTLESSFQNRCISISDNEEHIDKFCKWETKWRMDFHLAKYQVLKVSAEKNPIQFEYKLHYHGGSTYNFVKYNKSNLRDLIAATGLVISNWIFQIIDFSVCVTLKFDGLPWKIIGHFFYTTSSFVHHFKSTSEFKLELKSENAQFGSIFMIFCPVWP